MRVIAGEARRLQLVTPDGTDTRPTQDRIKETLFNIIQADIPGAVFADICAGSGGIGIEALSRGASRAYFVENSKKALACIQANLHTTRFEEKATVLRQDAVSALHYIHEKQIDIIYLDPPYQTAIAKDVLAALSRCTFVTDETIIIVETALDTDFSYLEEIDFEIIREKDYKTQRHLFIRRADER